MILAVQVLIYNDQVFGVIGDDLSSKLNRTKQARWAKIETKHERFDRLSKVHEAEVQRLHDYERLVWCARARLSTKAEELAKAYQDLMSYIGS